MSISRRTPIPRGPAPARRTALQRGGRLPRNPLASRSTVPSRGLPAVRTGPADPLPTAVRAAVYARADDRCEICGDPLRAGWRSVQHRKRRGAGGSADTGRHRLSNLLAVCGRNSSELCHRRADCDSDRYDHGWQLRTGDDPTAIPVLYRGRRILLDDQGGIEPIRSAAA